MTRQENGIQDMLVSIDTEYFQHHGRLHRPGGKFACLTIAEKGRTRGNSMFVSLAETRTILKELAQHTDTIVMQNALYDIRQLKASGLWPKGWKPELWDTMLAEQALFGGKYQLNSLADLNRRWLKTYLNKVTVSEFATAEKLTPAMKKYALADAAATLAIAKAQHAYVNSELDGEFKWYHEIDLPAMWAVLDMPPIRMDVDGWLDHGETLLQEGIKLQDELGFNVKSTPQVKEALHNVGIKVRKNQSADVDACTTWLSRANLKGNSRQISLLTKLMRARKCRDAHSKYGASWIDKNVEDGQWIYPNWSVTGADTGRMSCSKPNMQNIPKRGDGSIYRSFFLATVGGRLLVGDVVQQEPRFSAFLSRDSKLIEEIKNDVDLHQRAADLFNIHGRDARARGKAINLGLNYGMSAAGLAARVGISKNEAEDGINARQRHYSRYYAWQDRQIRQAERLSYVNTVTGRPVWVNPYNFKFRRNAINGPIQGSAADQTKLALAYVHSQCASANIPFVVNLVVHDELVLDVPRGMMKTYRRILKDAWMEAGKKLMPTLPTGVDMNSGTSWRTKDE